MGGNGEGRPIETVTTELSDTKEPREGDGVVAAEHLVSDEQLYWALKRMRSLATDLNVAGARTGDGLFNAHAHTALTTAGILRQLLEERGSPLLEVLQAEEAEPPNTAGVRQLPLR